MQDKISRKEAIQKLGKYGKFTALTAFGTFAILNPQMAQAGSEQGLFGTEAFNPNGNNGIGIWGSDNRYNRFKNEGFRVPFSNDAQYGPFQNGSGLGGQLPNSSGRLTPFQNGSAPSSMGSSPIWK